MQNIISIKIEWQNRRIKITRSLTRRRTSYLAKIHKVISSITNMRCHLKVCSRSKWWVVTLNLCKCRIQECLWNIRRWVVHLNLQWTRKWCKINLPCSQTHKIRHMWVQLLVTFQVLHQTWEVLQYHSKWPVSEDKHRNTIMVLQDNHRCNSRWRMEPRSQVCNSLDSHSSHPWHTNNRWDHHSNMVSLWLANHSSNSKQFSRRRP